MTTLADIKSALPPEAKDTKLNIGSLFGQITTTGLTEQQFLGSALAVAYTLDNKSLTEAVLSECEGKLSDDGKKAAKIAASLMAMNNVYYRFVHLVSDQEFKKLPANLRMNMMADPGVDKADFELFSLAVSAVNGCGMCIDAHVHALRKHNISTQGIQSSIRLAAVLSAADQGLRMAAE